MKKRRNHSTPPKLTGKKLAFVDHVRKQARKLRVKFRLSPHKSIRIKTNGKIEYVEGVFIDPTRRLHRGGLLAVAIKNKRSSEWLWDLAHEYEHMLQWFRRDYLWLNNRDRGESPVSYYELEKATERAARKHLIAFGLYPGPNDLLRSRNYLAKRKMDEEIRQKRRKKRRK